MADEAFWAALQVLDSFCLEKYVLIWYTILEDREDAHTRGAEMVKNSLIRYPIYTIGYGNRSIADVLKLLQAYDIAYVVDVRTYPYSKWSPEFSRDKFAYHLNSANIKYNFMGDKLGGRPKNKTYYTPDGHVDYSLLREDAAYKDGIQRLLKAQKAGTKFAVMCSEEKPQNCHRTKLISQTLRENGIEVQHIDENGLLISQEDAMRLVAGEEQLPPDKIIQVALFQEVAPMRLTSRKSYKKSTRSK